MKLTKDTESFQKGMKVHSNNKYIFVVCLMFFSFFARSTSMNPVPIEEQLRTSDGIIHGHYKGIQQDDKIDQVTGIVFTEHSLELISTAGINPQKKRYEFLTVGGVWQGIRHEIPGAPRFEEDEEIVLLLKNGSMGHIIHNSSLGKYSVVNRDGQKILVNDVAPDDNRLSNFSFDQFNGYVRERFGSNLERVRVSANLRKSKKKNYLLLALR